MLTIYQRAKKLGCEISRHESDLYLPATPAVLAMIAEWEKETGRKSNATRFTSSSDGKPWLDIPFAYDPFWPARMV